MASAYEGNLCPVFLTTHSLRKLKGMTIQMDSIESITIHKEHRVTLDYLALKLNGDWYDHQRRKGMSALFFKLPCTVHQWPTASSAVRESRRWDVITTIKRIIWYKWTPRCSRVPSVTITLHCNLVMWLHYNTAYKGVTHRAPVLLLSRTRHKPPQQPLLLGLSQITPKWVDLKKRQTK